MNQSFEQTIQQVLAQVRDNEMAYQTGKGSSGKSDEQAVQAIMTAHKAEVERVALENSIETGKQCLAIYRAPSREAGEKMFDFDNWLPQQIQEWEKALETLSNNNGSGKAEPADVNGSEERI